MELLGHSHREHVLDLVGQNKGQLIRQALGQIVQIDLVPPRQDEGLDSGSPSGQRLLLDATNRQHLSAQA